MREFGEEANAGDSGQAKAKSQSEGPPPPAWGSEATPSSASLASAGTLMPWCLPLLMARAWAWYRDPKRSLGKLFSNRKE